MTQPTNETVIMMLMGEPAEVEAQAAQLRQLLDVIEESPSTPLEDDPTRVRRKLTIRSIPDPTTI